MRPRAPITIRFWDSVSTHTMARTLTNPSRGCSSSSTSTSTACGSSANVRAITASRTSSASRSSRG